MTLSEHTYKNPVHGDQPGEKNREEETFFGYRKVKAGEKSSLVRDHFDSIARKYDFMNTLFSFGLHHLWKHTAINSLGLHEGDRVIDVCGGTGDLTVLAARQVGPSGEVVLYDINNAMITLGRDKVDRTSLARVVAFVQGDVERICVADAQFDAAIVGFGIRNVTDMQKGFEEMYRVLKPRGKFVCLEFSTPTSALFRSLYDFYSFSIMPKVGKLFTGSSQAYRYLPESIRLFPSPQQLSDILTGIGFGSVSYLSLTNGIAVIHKAVKV